MITDSLQRFMSAFIRMMICLLAVAMLLPVSHVLTYPLPKGERKAGDIAQVEIAKGVKMQFCWVPAGEAQLGSPKEEQDYVVKTFFNGERQNWLEEESELARGKFKTNGFWMGKYAVTQAEWKAVMGNNPSYFVPTQDEIKTVGITNTAHFPVENVSWNDCQEFLAKLNDTTKLATVKFDLPHEDQWEYACRGGRDNTQPFYFGEKLDGNQANCDGNFPYGTVAKGPNLQRTSEVGSYEKAAKHPWDLCDMHGNVLQWCRNKFGGKNNHRVLRGGMFCLDPRYCRSACRLAYAPDYRDAFIGFRVVCLP